MENCLIMDNDSGYVSHNQESNFDSSCENVCDNKKSKSFSSRDVYMSEDALLEKPFVKEKCRFDSFDSVLSSSQESVKTEFSGFEDSDRSDVSFIIPEAKPIIWNSSGCKERDMKEESEESFLNCSQDSVSSYIETPSKSFSVSHTSNRAHKILANVTNTYDETLNQAVIKNVFRDSDNKENIAPSATPKKQYENRLTSDISPDLFDDEEEKVTKAVVPIRQKSPMKRRNTNNNNDKDVKLLKKVQSCLSGVCPPPSLTTIQMSVTEMLSKIEDNKHLFWFAFDEKREEKERLSTGQLNFPSVKWPEIVKLRQHGFHYNRNKISEEFEHLCSRYAERYVGAETQSTCTVFETNPPTSVKRKLSKPSWMAKSPGRRLSHLARRRITFSNSTLQGASSAVLGSRGRQILVDAKKLNMLHKKSPKKTPSKSPFKVKKNTPSSSAKKKLAMRFREMAGEFGGEPSSSSSDRYNFKRALFNSPNQEKGFGTSGILMEKKSTKRALFSSPLKRSSPNKSPYKLGKRKRNDIDEENPSKFARSMSLDLRPSQSESKLILNRTLSDTSLRTKNEELSEQHKKKLQWAVYESLRLQNITASHPQYKVFASVLARVTRKFLPSVRLEGRTTEKMFRVARYHSYAVVKGKTVDEIVNEYMKNKLKNQKPQGYIGIEEFQSMKNNSFIVDKENVLQDKANIIESIEKRREHAGSKQKFLNENRIDRIKKVISFEESVNKKV